MKVVRMTDLPREPAVSPLFTGQVFRQSIVDPAESKSFNFSIVNFSAGSRNKFHQHTSDQILIVTEGTGVVATEAGARRRRCMDVVWTVTFGVGPAFRRAGARKKRNGYLSNQRTLSRRRGGGGGAHAVSGRRRSEGLSERYTAQRVARLAKQSRF